MDGTEHASGIASCLCCMLLWRKVYRPGMQASSSLFLSQLPLHLLLLPLLHALEDEAADEAAGEREGEREGDVDSGCREGDFDSGCAAKKQKTTKQNKKQQLHTPLHSPPRACYPSGGLWEHGVVQLLHACQGRLLS